MPQMDPQVWIRAVTADSAWIGPYTLTGMAGAVFFPTFQGTDCTIIVNTGPNFAPSGTQPLTPPGVFPGWLGPDGTFSAHFQNDPARLAGSAIVLNNASVSFPTTPGMAQMNAPQFEGGWYFEVTNAGQSLFTNNMGGGAGRDMTETPGLDINFWTPRGQHSIGDTLGGGLLCGGNFTGPPTYRPGVNGVGNSFYQFPFYSWQEGEVMAFAVLISPIEREVIYNPATILPVTLPCVPCCTQCVCGSRMF